jgi:hypothetical protein
VRRATGEKESIDGSRRPTETGRGPEDQLLVELGGAAVDGSGDQAGIDRLEVAWHLDGAADDQLSESGSVPLNQLLDNVHVSLKTVGFELETRGHMGIRPSGFRSGGRTGRIGRGHLPEQDERAARHAPGRQIGREVNEPVYVNTEMHCPGQPSGLGDPRDRAGHGPIDLQGWVIPLELPHIRDEPRRQLLVAD